ncbi:hypothetical protein BDR03DRAFT_1008640 [Suillus americanus]|nr:hypothetical protein BDR03DRAFT_1008640 [Suillus americanus]
MNGALWRPPSQLNSAAPDEPVTPDQPVAPHQPMAHHQLDTLFLHGEILPHTSAFGVLVSDAYQHFLACRPAMNHLAKMILYALVTNPSMEDINECIKEIKSYLHSHFPTIQVVTLEGSYGETPMPETFPGYNQGPFPSLSSAERQTWRLQFSLHSNVYDLYTGASTPQAKQTLAFFLHLVIIHELTHVVMLVFSSEPTPTKFYGSRPLDSLNGLGLKARGQKVERGESGASMEQVITGGEVVLLMPHGRHMADCDPNSVDVGIVGSTLESFQMLANSPFLYDIASGQWDLILQLPMQSIPDHMLVSHQKISSSQICRNCTPSSPSLSTPATTPANHPGMLLINPDAFPPSGEGHTEYQRRMARMVVVAQGATGRRDLVAWVSQLRGSTSAKC